VYGVLCRPSPNCLASTQTKPGLLYGITNWKAGWPKTCIGALRSLVTCRWPWIGQRPRPPAAPIWCHMAAIPTVHLKTHSRKRLWRGAHYRGQIADRGAVPACGRPVKHHCDYRDSTLAGRILPGEPALAPAPLRNTTLLAWWVTATVVWIAAIGLGLGGSGAVGPNRPIQKNATLDAVGHEWAGPKNWHPSP